MLNSHYKDMLRELSDHHVEYLVVGAIALAVHGIPRATGDIDIWVNATPENAQRVYRALEAFGAPLEGLSQDDFTGVDMVFQIGVVPLRIDILTAVDGVSFDEAWADKIVVDFDGLPMSVLSKKLMIQNKRASGRLKDRLDLEALEKIENDGES